MKEKPVKRNILQWLPGILISLIAIYFLSRFINPAELFSALGTLNLIDILIISGLLIISLVARSLGWKNLLEKVNFKQAFLVVNEGYLFNNLIPRSGEIIRTLLVSGASNVSAFQVASSVLVERVLDVVIAASMFLLTLPLAVEMEWIKPIAWVLFICCMIALAALFFMAFRSESVKRWLRSLKTNSKLIKEIIIPKIGAVIDGLSALKDPIKISKSIFWILTSWFIWTSLLYYAITRLLPGAPVWWAIFTQGVLALGIALPSAPAGLGVYEGTMVAALAVFGFNENSSLSIALVVHFIQILITTVIGIYALVSQGQSISALLKRIRIRKSKEAINPMGEK